MATTPPTLSDQIRAQRTVLGEAAAELIVATEKLAAATTKLNAAAGALKSIATAVDLID
jgi:hypothetical protein